MPPELQLQFGTPGLHNLNHDVMRLARADLKVATSGSDDAIAIGLSQFVIINSLGLDFWNRECRVESSPQPFLSEEPEIGQLRLATMLWSAREIEGFERWLQRARNDDIEAAYYELDWLTFFVCQSEQAKLNVPSNRKGADFDIELVKCLGFDLLNVEVKTRTKPLETTQRTTNFINNARRQLPSNRLGAVVVRLTVPETMAQTAMDDAFCKAVRNSSRLEFIGYSWEIRDGNMLFQHLAFVTANGRDDMLGQFTPFLVTSATAIALFCRD